MDRYTVQAEYLMIPSGVRLGEGTVHTWTRWTRFDLILRESEQFKFREWWWSYRKKRLAQLDHGQRPVMNLTVMLRNGRIAVPARLVFKIDDVHLLQDMADPMPDGLMLEKLEAWNIVETEWSPDLEMCMWK
jgi:hypothetical protein